MDVEHLSQHVVERGKECLFVMKTLVILSLTYVFMLTFKWAHPLVRLEVQDAYIPSIVACCEICCSMVDLNLKIAFTN